MDNPSHRMRHQQKQNEEHAESQTAGLHQESREAPLEFSSVEEMLQADAVDRMVPDRVAKKLQKSLSLEPPPASRSWWSRIFGAKP